MATNLAGIETGMEVFDSNGEKIGKISDILTIQAQSQVAATSSYAATDTGFDTGTGSLGTGGSNILKVDQGGILGIGAKELFIPFSAVQTVVPGESISINCTKDACGSMFGEKPEFLP